MTSNLWPKVHTCHYSAGGCNNYRCFFFFKVLKWFQNCQGYQWLSSCQISVIWSKVFEFLIEFDTDAYFHLLEMVSSFGFPNITFSYFTFVHFWTRWNVFTFVILFTFVHLSCFTYVTVRWLHRKPLWSPWLLFSLCLSSLLDWLSSASKMLMFSQLIHKSVTTPSPPALLFPANPSFGTLRHSLWHSVSHKSMFASLPFSPWLQIYFILC